MRILITGFGRFPGAAANPSGPLARTLARRRRPAFSGCTLAAHVFATAYADIDQNLPALLARHRPDVLLMFGLAGKERGLRIETRAGNRVSAIHPDAAGRVPPRGLIAPAPPSRAGRAPGVALRAAALGQSVPARLSRDAGAYVCNYLYWHALAAPVPLVALVHIPRPPARRRPARRPSPAAVLAAAEAMLAALIAAARPATFPSETMPMLRP